MCARSSVVRSFRYVATLTAQQIVTSLVGACQLLGEARETAQRQLTAEKAKKGSKVSFDASDESQSAFNTPALGALLLAFSCLEGFRCLHALVLVSCM